MSPLMAQSGQIETVRYLSALGGEADLALATTLGHRPPCSIISHSANRSRCGIDLRTGRAHEIHSKLSRLSTSSCRYRAPLTIVLVLGSFWIHPFGNPARCEMCRIVHRRAPESPHRARTAARHMGGYVLSHAYSREGQDERFRQCQTSHRSKRKTVARRADVPRWHGRRRARA